MSAFAVRPLKGTELHLVALLRLSREQERFLPEEFPVSTVKSQQWGLWLLQRLVGIVEIVGEPPVLWISRIGIDVDYQGLGYGQAGLEALLRVLGRSLRVREVRAAVHRENLPARRLFEKVGFRAVGEPDEMGEVVYYYSFR
ncbi:MAG: GNAT family N-acetyltransferase [Bacteroidia bacterium]|nr:GNAT family N-acetyltransferase [Bacteroidia bacterium]